MEYLSLLLIGLSYGATACMFSCMPFLSPLLLMQEGNAQALRTVSLFSVGRIASYGTSALIAFFGALAFRHLLDDPLLSQSVLGGSTVLVGTLLLLRTFRFSACCSSSRVETETIGGIGVFGMGFAIAMTPCTPVLSLAALAAGADSAPEALLMGVTFGIGAVAVSWALFGFLFPPVARHAVAKLTKYQIMIQRVAALLMMGLGMNVLRSVVQL